MRATNYIVEGKKKYSKEREANRAEFLKSSAQEIAIKIAEQLKKLDRLPNLKTTVLDARTI